MHGHCLRSSVGQTLRSSAIALAMPCQRESLAPSARTENVGSAPRGAPDGGGGGVGVRLGSAPATAGSLGRARFSGFAPGSRGRGGASVTSRAVCRVPCSRVPCAVWSCVVRRAVARREGACRAWRRQVSRAARPRAMWSCAMRRVAMRRVAVCRAPCIECRVAVCRVPCGRVAVSRASRARGRVARRAGAHLRRAARASSARTRASSPPYACRRERARGRRPSPSPPPWARSTRRRGACR